jgi:HNH endonuclease
MVDDFVAALCNFEPRLCEPFECAEIVERLAHAEKALAAARTRAAVRAAEAGVHRAKGYVHAHDWLALPTGGSVQDAQRALTCVAQLDDLPETKEALDSGDLSLAQASEIALTVARCPDAEHDMVARARGESLRTLRDHGRNLRLAAFDPEDLHRRQRSARFHRHWRDDLGMIRYSGAMVPDVGVPFVNRLDAMTNRECRRARRAGETDSREQLAADAFASAVAGQGKGHATRADVVFVCDVTTGATHIVGGGPVPAATMREAARHGFIKAVLHDGVQVDTVVHYGRKKAPAIIRTVLELGDAPAFDGVRCVDCGRQFGIELDHIDPVANDGPTCRQNLAPRCGACHDAKTERDRIAGLLQHKVRAMRRRQPP